MKRVRLVVAYDGTNYCGWQIQPNANTIEEEINKALKDLLAEDIAVIGASRTDSGVHALGNVAIFDTETQIPSEKISFALNQRLPEDIRVVKSDEVPSDWHPRYQNSVKTYEYRIVNREIPDPTRRLYAHFTYSKLNVDEMRKASEYLVGEHDFASFCSAGSQVESTVREIKSLNIDNCSDEIVITVSGNGFLYNMVRIIVGTLLEIGEGKIKAEEIKDILEAKDREKAGPTAVAKGLKLVKIEYEN